MKRARGFTLIELVVVMVLVALLTGIGAAVVGAALPGRELRAAAKQIAGQLRFTRAQAIATGTEQVFELDVIGKRWRAAGERTGEISDDIALRVITARGESPAQDVAAVRFFPDGAATGGRIILKYDEAAWRVDIGWLTGEVTLTRGEGRE